jgi:PIN domain nuclease of toxin-antitoxin system
MKFLLDTHAFIWWASNSAMLPPKVMSLFLDPANMLLLSVVSVWEMQIKIQLGRMNIGRPLRDLVEHYTNSSQMRLLPVELEHILALDNLPAHHKDPFDRLLIAQAVVEGASLVSGDSIFASYPVNWLW